MQTEAGRPDGGTGYPGLRLRPDVMGTADGLARAPYVRESRRIRALHTIVEQEVSRAVRGRREAVSHEDSVGVGSYPIDLHPTTGGDNYLDIDTCPFEIPLRALVPVRMRNLLPAARNLGTTHVTNGCYRLAPIEWNVGEAAASLACTCLEHATIPAHVAEEGTLREELQSRLARQGVQLRWPRARAASD
jgi:hypothetical protein